MSPCTLTGPVWFFAAIGAATLVALLFVIATIVRDGRGSAT